MNATSQVAAVRELDLEHPHLLLRGDVLQALIREFPVGIPNTVLRRAELEHDVRAAFKVRGGQVAFAGVQPDAGCYPLSKLNDTTTSRATADSNCADVIFIPRLTTIPW